MRPNRTAQPRRLLTCTVGIDLGITNSQVAVCSGGSASLVRDRAGEASLPMSLACVEDKIVLGQAARRQRLTNPSTIFGVSRLLGRKLRSPAVNAMQERLPYRLMTDERGAVALEVGGRIRTCEEICAALLRRLRAMAEAFLGDTVTQALVAVPAHFDEAQRAAVVASAELAGLQVNPIEAPRAALRAFFPADLPGGTRQMVVHLGGASCEVTILDVGSLAAEVIAVAADPFLGEALDAAIVELLLATPAAARHPGLRQDSVSRQRLQEAAERAKWEAGSQGEAVIDLPHLHVVGDRELHLQMTLPRARLDALAQPMLKELLELCLAALDRARLDPHDIGGLVLVGGQSRLDCTCAALGQLLSCPLQREPDPENTVARGAAMEALLQAEPPEVELQLDL